MNKRNSIVLALGLVVLGVLIPIVPRLVTALIWPHQYDDQLFGADLIRFALLVAWNALPFAVLALVVYIGLTRLPAARLQQATALGGVLGALIPGLALGLWIHTPDPNRIGFNFGVGFFPFYMLVLMPVGFWLGALLGRYSFTRAARS